MEGSESSQKGPVAMRGYVVQHADGGLVVRTFRGPNIWLTSMNAKDLQFLQATIEKTGPHTYKDDAGIMETVDGYRVVAKK